MRQLRPQEEEWFTQVSQSLLAPSWGRTYPRRLMSVGLLLGSLG